MNWIKFISFGLSCGLIGTLLISAGMNKYFIYGMFVTISALMGWYNPMEIFENDKSNKTKKNKKK